MVDPHWRNRVSTALRKQGLPQSYINRLVEELADHATDLVFEEKSMDAHERLEARLGSPEALAAAAKQEYQRRTFAGRHPALMFLAGPIVLMLGMLVASSLLVVGAVELIDTATGGELSANDGASGPSDFEMSLMQSLNLPVRFAPFLLPAVFFTWLGRRSGRRTWSIAACAIVAVTAVCFHSVVYQMNGKGVWMMGFGWRGWQVGLDQLLQAAVPLALTTWMLRQLWLSARSARELAT
jgi:hypothetical protein